MDKARHVAVLLLMLATAVCSTAQESTATGRKRVAVVLSGGGAKGMAHIGALKVIERAGIPIDIITGTSMGSIVGGLYAIGYNAHALDSMVRVQDWGYVISDRENLSRQTLADRQRQNTYFYTTGLTLGKRNQTDGGIIKGKNLAELFYKLCEGYNDSLDFSRDLPIPFACVATDIIDNSEVVFHSGGWASMCSSTVGCATTTLPTSPARWEPTSSSASPYRAPRRLPRTWAVP